MRQILAFLVLCLSSQVNLVYAEMTETDLIQKWEDVNRTDPKTIHFEKIDERTYEFKTSRFEFDGIIKIKDINIDDNDYGGPMEFNTGTITLDLGLPEEEMYKNLSLRRWMAGNSFIFDKNEGNWLTQKEYGHKMMAKSSRSIIWDKTSSYFWLAFFVVIVIFSVRLQIRGLGRADKSIRMTEEAIGLQRETNKLLSELLETVKQKNMS